MPTLDFTEASKIIAQGFIACTRVRKRLARKVKSWI
jgi:hypothetical protein